MKEKAARSITVNQIGYPLHEKKIAIITNNDSGVFQVMNERTNETVYQGALTGPVFDKVSNSKVFHGDFSSLQTTGTYYVMVGNSKSASFMIDSNPYEKLQQGLLKAFYYLRCGMDLEEEFAGPWKHKACHLKEGIVYGDTKHRLDSSGGWHDAGDYGKYTVAGAKAIADLLLAFEIYPTAFEKTLPIPESDGRTPDVLHECKYELDWLFKMQDAETGGVFHKLTTLTFPGLDVMPEQDNGDLYFSPISATATATYAAVMAMSSRVYREYNQEFSIRCLEAAKLAWKWLENNPEYPSFKNPPEISTGEYGDQSDLDERYWAAAELFRTTGERVYHHAFKELANATFPKYELGWADDGGYGTLAYLLNGRENAEPKLYDHLKQGWKQEANRLIERSKDDGYFVSLSENDYIWGSNMLLLNHAMVLLFAFYFEGMKEFETSALDHVHYLVGRNILDISYVTGFGDKPVKHIHHRPSVGDDVMEPVPGFVSGGPNKNLQDDISKQTLRGNSPPACFIDHIDSYATNEITIYWNSPAVFVLSHFIK
ncbi:glycoside hydrolase family 9 protein [Aquibacillus albus]|uniref:Endoglucanase n=1 Tax=Aquibacillus albus TaxID=1168171 RepID=A0ABS2MY23_9BACI|nr:glycoside hydrolase family 9 protein [Aquibacillus albus]MBM7570787.1 endoglucanase [Aquibacillus albus]